VELVVTDNVPVCIADPIDFAATDRVQLDPDAIVVPQLFVENAILLVIGPMAIGEPPLFVTVTFCETHSFAKLIRTQSVNRPRRRKQKGPDSTRASSHISITL
jgi:hypothetical protein